MSSTESDPPTPPTPTPPPGSNPPNDPSAAGNSSSSPKKRPITLQTLFPRSVIFVLDDQPQIPTKRRDEHCFTYCYQTALSRSKGEQAVCTTLCWRKLFPHERPPQTQAQSKARAEGDVPWFDGRYIYFGRSIVRLEEKLKGMRSTGITPPQTAKEMAPQTMAGLNEEQTAHLEQLM
jgi:hypothetical protein